MNFNFHTGLSSCLTAILSSGLVGYSNTHCDIGGYYHIENQFIKVTERSEILLVRWMQLAAFTAVFRTHEGNKPDHTLQVYSNRYLARSFAFYSQIFSTLSAYRKHHAYQS
jgi:alpha-glucosidase